MNYSLNPKSDSSKRIDELEKRVSELRDDNIRYRRTMEDMLYNLTLDNMPTVRAALEATAITPSIVTEYLYSANARIADLTCLCLRTDYDKPLRYLSHDPSSLRYIYIHDSVFELITAAVAEPTEGEEYPTEQYVSADGTAVYWTDESHGAMTVEQTDYPVTVYSYTESTEMSFSFAEYIKSTAYETAVSDGEAASGEGDGEGTGETELSTADVLTYESERSYAPSVSLGAPELDANPSLGQAHITRRGNGFDVGFFPHPDETGKVRRAGLSLTGDGHADATHRRASVSLSEEDGLITVTPEGASDSRSALLSGGTVGYGITADTESVSGSVRLLYPDGGEFSFTPTPASDSGEWSRRELLTAAVGISLGIPWTDTRPSFGFKITVGSDSYTFSSSTSSYPLEYDGTLTVDWGDGVREDFRDGVNPTHVYESAGDYTVIYRGCIRTMRFAANSALTELLTALPYTMTAGFDNCFLRCTSLTTIPENLFENVSVPSDTGLYSTFRQSGIVSIPDHLFDYCRYVTLFSHTFWGCRSNTTISERLLSSIRSPQLLYGTFCANTSFTGWIPEIWNRFPDADGTGCFGACSNALNYDAVPTDWKKSVS